MPISDYAVPRDKFQLNRGAVNVGFDFPRNQCTNNSKEDNEEPCRTCDHNINAVLEDDGVLA